MLLHNPGNGDKWNIVSPARNTKRNTKGSQESVVRRQWHQPATLASLPPPRPQFQISAPQRATPFPLNHCVQDQLWKSYFFSSLQECILTTWHLMLDIKLICLYEQNIQHFGWIPFLPCCGTPFNFACFLQSLLKRWRLPFCWLDRPHHSVVCYLMLLGCSHSHNCFSRLLLRVYIISEFLSKESVIAGMRKQFAN